MTHGVIWSEAASQDLREIRRWTELGRSPAEVKRTGRRLVAAAVSLAIFPNRGRSGQVAGTRELSAPPFVIAYRLHPQAGQVEILRILHGARRWPEVL